MACYETFGWTPDEVRDLPFGEATKLAIYFAETGKYQHKRRREIEAQTGSSSPSPHASSSVATEVEIGSHEDDIEGYDDD